MINWPGFKNKQTHHMHNTDIWTPVIGQTLYLKREPTNRRIKTLWPFMIPYNLAPYLSRFMARDVNKTFAAVIGEKVNRGAGYRLDIPCMCLVYGPKTYVNKLKELTDSLKN